MNAIHPADNLLCFIREGRGWDVNRYDEHTIRDTNSVVCGGLAAGSGLKRIQNLGSRDFPMLFFPPTMPNIL